MIYEITNDFGNPSRHFIEPFILYVFLYVCNIFMSIGNNGGYPFK